MKRIEARARILDDSHQPVAGVDVRLQMFGLSDAGWRDLAAAKSDSGGNVAIGADQLLDDSGPAPNLRLLRASDGAVLADGGVLRYAKTTQVLSADFGEVAMLPEVVRPTVLMRGLGAAASPIGGFSTKVAAAVVAGAGAAAPQVATLSARTAELETENANLRVTAERAGRLERSNQELTLQVQRVPELERQLAEKTQLSERLSRDVERVGALESQLGQTKQENARLAAAAARAAALEKQLGDAQSEITKLRAPAERTLTVAALASEIGTQIGRAQQEIRQQPGSMALSSVKIRMKGIMDGPARMTLPSKDELSRPEIGNQMSDMDLSFAAAPPAPAPVDDVQVPDLRRLTESVVRQVLHSLGLRLTVVQGPREAGGVATGQAALQAPSAGERAKRGAAVTVVFAG